MHRNPVGRSHFWQQRKYDHIANEPIVKILYSNTSYCFLVISKHLNIQNAPHFYFKLLNYSDTYVNFFILIIESKHLYKHPKILIKIFAIYDEGN